MEDTQKDASVVLGEKMLKEIQDGHPYEALQLAESYVARKKKTLGRNKTSALVFHGCSILIQSKANSDAGSLLSWFIEDGAGDDYYFTVNDTSVGDQDNYCDLQRLIDLLRGLSPEDSYPIVEKIYGPVHKLIVKKNLEKSSKRIVDKLQLLEGICIDTFEANRNWYSAYKAIVRIGDMPRAARILNSWALEGYTSEHPLFFARAVMMLLSEGHIQKANGLLQEAEKYVVETPDIPGAENAQSASLAIWHVAKILAELASMEPKLRVDKVKIFGIITSKYQSLILRVDPKLTLLYDKIGQNAFGIRSANADQPNPMAAMLQGMFASGAPPTAPAPAASKAKAKAKAKAKIAAGGAGPIAP